jgi:hypothetical protein
VRLLYDDRCRPVLNRTRRRSRRQQREDEATTGDNGAGSDQ